MKAAPKIFKVDSGAENEKSLKHSYLGALKTLGTVHYSLQDQT